MSGRQQWHWVKVSAPGVSAGTAARRSGRLRWIEDRWTKRGGADDGRRRLRGFHAAATIRATARRSRARAAGARTTVRPDGRSLAGGRALPGRRRRLGGALSVAVPVRRAGPPCPNRCRRLSNVHKFQLRAVFVLALPADRVCVPVVRDRRVRAVGAVRAAAVARSATRQADHRVGRANPRGAIDHARPGLVGRPAAGAAAGGGGRRSVRYPYRTHGSSRRRRGRGICGAGRRRRRCMGAPH